MINQIDEYVIQGEKTNSFNDSDSIQSSILQEYTNCSTLERIKLKNAGKHLAVKETADFLAKNKYPALPVVPRQSATKYPLSCKDKEGEWQPVYEKDGITPKPRFTGKNPSYFLNGKPKILKHQPYQIDLPTQDELEQWFSDPNVGVGSLGGWDDGIWLDFDVEKFRGKKEELDSRINELLEAHPSLQSSWIDETHSGGWRIWVKPKVRPSFTNFSLDGTGGDHHGEALGYGRFTVLSPTIGVSGNRYVNHNLGLPVEIDSLESIGIYPSSAEKLEKTKRENHSEHPTTLTEEVIGSKSGIALPELLSVKVKSLLKGISLGFKDSSETLTLAIKETFGWVNILTKIGIPIERIDLIDLFSRAAQTLNIDDARMNRIIYSVDTSNCEPGIFHQKGELGFWEKISHVNKKIFKKYCPVEMEAVIEAKEREKHITKWKELRKLSNGIKQNRQYLNLTEEIHLEKILTEGGYLIIIKTCMGGGKSTGVLKVLKSLYEKKQEGFFFLTHRTKLNFQICTKAIKQGIPSNLLTDADISGLFGVSLVSDDTESFFLCGESTIKIESSIYNRNLVIDEVAALLPQLMNGKTVKGSRQAKTLKALERCLQMSGNVIAMDANITDIEVDILRELSGKKVIVIENEHKPEQSKITFLTSAEFDELGYVKDLKSDQSGIAKKILESERPFVTSDSKRFLKDSLETEFAKKGKFGFTLCQDTANETWQDLEARRPGSLKRFKPKDASKRWGDELLSDPDKFILKYRPEYAEVSPTGESGLSIDIRGYFTEKFLIGTGTISLNSLSQILFRLRDNSIPTFVLVPDAGYRTEDRDFYVGSTEITLEDKLERTKLTLEATLEGNSELANAIEVAGLASARLSRIWEDYGRRLIEREKLERGRYKEFFRLMLEEMGHVVIEEMTEADEILDSCLRENRKEATRKEAEDIFNAPNVPYEDADKNFQVNPSPQNYRIKAKAALLRYLPEIDKSDVWTKDFVLLTLNQPNYRSGHDYYYLLKNTDLSKKFKEFTYYEKLTSEFVSNHQLSNKKSDILTGLTNIGFDKLVLELESGAEIHKGSQIVEETVRQGNLKKNELLIGFKPGRLTTSGKERMDYIRKLVELVGLKLAKPAQRLLEGVKTRFYKLDTERDDVNWRDAVLESLKKYYEKWESEQYIKPEWEFSANNEGAVHPKFVNEDWENKSNEFWYLGGFNELNDEQPNYEQQNYEMPSLVSVKVASGFYKFRTGLLSKYEVPTNVEMVEQGLELLTKMENNLSLRKMISEEYPLDFPELLTTNVAHYSSKTLISVTS